MNRKLIRPNLADVKGKEREAQIIREPPRTNSSSLNNPVPRRPINMTATATSTQRSSSSSGHNSGSSLNTGSVMDEANISLADSNSAASQKNRRNPPPVETNAEVYYYKKQIDSHTLMVIVLTDNEEIEGTIEWYDRHALKVNRENAPNIMLLKHNIKYMFKADEKADTAKATD